MRFKLFFVLLLVLAVSCKKKKTTAPTAVPTTLEHGILVLNEGLFQHNNSSLSWINTTDGSINNSFFEEKTNRGLGDTGNDLKQYGGKIYVIVNVSSTLEILNAKTGQSIKQIPLFSGNTAKQPRSIAFNGAKAYISCYDGYVDVIDTATLIVETRIPVGQNPEGLAVSNGKLYVANSGGLNYPNVDSTVSVIQLSTNQEITRITVGKNPGSVCVDSQGDIYVISRGNYGTIPSRMHRIDTQTDTKVQSFTFDAGGITNFNSNLLISYTNSSASSSAVALFDPSSETLINANFLPLGNITTLYGVSYSPLTDKIYCCDANGYTTTGYVVVFSSNGAFETSYHVGLNPSKVLIYE
jgi:YVTN family beta-propeller protein